MNERLTSDPRKNLDHIKTTCLEAIGRIGGRLLIEQLGLPVVNLPIGGEEGLEPVLSFVSMAKEGFPLDLKSDQVYTDETADLLHTTSWQPSDLSQVLKDLNIGASRKLFDQNPRLFFYRHSFAVLAMLSGIRTVSSEQLKVKFNTESHWPHELSKENVWFLLDEIEGTTQSLILKNENYISHESASRALHFFAAGKLLSQSFT